MQSPWQPGQPLCWYHLQLNSLIERQLLRVHPSSPRACFFSGVRRPQCVLDPSIFARTAVTATTSELVNCPARGLRQMIHSVSTLARVLDGAVQARILHPSVADSIQQVLHDFKYFQAAAVLSAPESAADEQIESAVRRVLHVGHELRRRWTELADLFCGSASMVVGTHWAMQVAALSQCEHVTRCLVEGQGRDKEVAAAVDKLQKGDPDSLSTLARFYADCVLARCTRGPNHAVAAPKAKAKAKAKAKSKAKAKAKATAKARPKVKAKADAKQRREAKRSSLEEQQLQQPPRSIPAVS